LQRKLSVCCIFSALDAAQAKQNLLLRGFSARAYTSDQKRRKENLTYARREEMDDALAGCGVFDRRVR
jgi:hypothetical protein